ncbi:MAG: hypothetical protein P8166_18835 [Candidatus Thiodiazotropha sp.]
MVGLSAGASIAAAALEILPYKLVSVGPAYPMHFDRTIMLSGPLGADVSYECKRIYNTELKKLLDKYFRTKQSCLYGWEIDKSKDVVDMDNKSFRSYLHPRNEIAIFVGKSDMIGSSYVSVGGGVPWTAIGAVERYIRSIGGGNDSFFTRVDQDSANQDNLYDFMLYKVNGGHDDLWPSAYVRKEICRHVFDEVNESRGTARKISLDKCKKI